MCSDQTPYQELLQLRERHNAWFDGEKIKGFRATNSICLNVAVMSPEQTLHQQLLQLCFDAVDWVNGLPAAGFSPRLGICSHLDLSVEGWGQFDTLVLAWPCNTGDNYYPVPHPRLDPVEAFNTVPLPEMWNPEYEYARNRWALLEWLIEQTAPTEESQP